MDPYEIEDTSDWLGSPTELETCRQFLRMYESDAEELTQHLTRARENVQGLVQMNDEMASRNARLTTELKKLASESARLREENSELSGRVRSLLLVSDQRDHLFDENQRLHRYIKEAQ